jgi:hypothetical protein
VLDDEIFSGATPSLSSVVGNAQSTRVNDDDIAKVFAQSEKSRRSFDSR